MKQFIFAVLLTILSPLLARSAYAQQVKVSVVPPQVHILMKSKVSLIKAFNFENLGDPGVFSFQLVSFTTNGDRGNIQLLNKAEGPIRFSLENSNLDFGTKFFVPNNTTTQAILKIRAVENAPQGDYYYTLLMTSEPPSSSSTVGRGSAIIGANIIISLTENGLTPSTVKIAQFQIIPRYKFNFFGKTFLIVEPTDEVPVILKLANTGQYLVTPDASIHLQGPFNANKQKKLLTQNVLSHSERLLVKRELDECIRCKTLPSAVFKGFYFGKYQLSADIGFIGINQKIFATSEFWALPIGLTKNILILFFISILVLLGLRKFKK